VVAFDTPLATDDCGTPGVVADPPSGSVFPKGTTTVSCTATDSGGLTAHCSFDVTVEDREPPELASTVALGTLWPPTHELVAVGLDVAASDGCSDPPVSVEVFGDEDDDEATGDGSESPDARQIAPGTLRLRAERKGDGDGRVYLIAVTSTDAAGNTARTCSTVVVPRNQGRLALARVEAEAAAARAFFFANEGEIPPGYFVIGDDASLRERRR
jgi:hypothetical protein